MEKNFYDVLRSFESRINIDRGTASSSKYTSKDKEIYALDEENEQLNINLLPLTFVPNFFIQQFLRDKDAFSIVPVSFDYLAVIFMVDVSGFTHLTEFYNKREDDSGADDLVSELNGYMINLASTINAFDGDILKFAGDAFLCQFKIKGSLQTIDVVQRAYNCAVYIQAPSTVIKKMLRVKIAITLGLTKMQVFGSPSEFLLYFASGQPVQDIHAAEEICYPGEIVITKDIYDCLKKTSTKLYNTVPHEKNCHFYRVSEIEDNLDSTFAIKSHRLELLEQCNPDTHPRIIALSRAFLIPILKKVRTRDQLNYLSEISFVTILFIMLPEIDIVSPQHIEFCLEIIRAEIKKYGGVLNKALLFDKGCSFLAVFGLPGLKHLDDVSRCLRCAHTITTSLSKSNVYVTMGISSGKCFCGLIGHCHRQEYTVIGWRVNMACRLMTTYSDHSIVLDNQTYEQSQKTLGCKNFVQLEYRALKGIASPPTIYAYKPSKVDQSYSLLGVKASSLLAFIPKKFKPTLGEADENTGEILMSMKIKSKRDAFREDEYLPVVFVSGASKSGKRFLLYYITALAKKMNYEVMTVNAFPSRINEPFATIAHVICHFFKILSFQKGPVETYISSFVKNKNDPYLYLLNHLLNSKFPMREDVTIYTEVINQNIERLFKEIILAICHSSSSSFLLIGIDDVENMDVWSWQLLADMMDEDSILIVLSTSDESEVLCTAGKEILSKAAYHLTYETYERSLLVDTICWFLDVDAVHLDAVNFFLTYAPANKQLMEEILKYSFLEKFLNIVPKHSQKGRSSLCLEATVMEEFKSKPKDGGYVCCLKKLIEVPKDVIPFNYEEFVTLRLNNLDIQERILLKRAAVLGFSFLYSILEMVNPRLSSAQFRRSIQKLMDCKILSTKYNCHDVKQDPNFVVRKQRILINVDFPNETVITRLISFAECPTKMVSSLFELHFTSEIFQTAILQTMTKMQNYEMLCDILTILQYRQLLCQDCSALYKKTRNVQSQSESILKSMSKEISYYRFNKCCCLRYRINVNDVMWTIYSQNNSPLNAMIFLERTAELYLLLNYPIKALTYVEYAFNVYPSALYNINTLWPKQAEKLPFEVHALLYSLKAEIFSCLNNSYASVDSITKALTLLKIDMVDLLSEMKILDTADFLDGSLRPNCKEICYCFSLLAEIYYQRHDCELAKRFSTYPYIFANSESISFCTQLRYKVLFYKCKLKADVLASSKEMESEILNLCHLHLQQTKKHVLPHHIAEMVEAYTVIIHHNLCQNKLEIAENICSEAMETFKALRVVNQVSRKIIVMLCLGVQACMHAEKYTSLVTFLTELYKLSKETNNDVGLGIYFVTIIELLDEDDRKIDTKVPTFNEYINYFDSEINISTPVDIAYFVCAKLSLWCLESKLMKGEAKSLYLFSLWYKRANNFSTSGIKSYWSIGGDLYMIQISMICNFVIKKLSYQEQREEAELIDNKMKVMRSFIKSKYYVFDVMFEEIVSDCTYLFINLISSGTGLANLCLTCLWFERVDFFNAV